MLLISNSANNNEAMRGMLEMHSFTSDVAFQGHAGLELAKRRLVLAMDRKAPMYQIIIIEFSMQDMDGCQVTQSIH